MTYPNDVSPRKLLASWLGCEKGNTQGREVELPEDLVLVQPIRRLS